MLLKRLCDFKLVKCRDTFADLKMDPNADKFRLTKPLGSEKTVAACNIFPSEVHLSHCALVRWL